MATTTTTPTTEQIRALRSEAAQNGDWMQVAICDMALGMTYSGEYPADDYSTLSAAEARRLNAMSRDAAETECARVIRAASDME